MKIRAILNLDEGIYLEAGNIVSLAVNEIPVDHDGNTAWALLAYPSPGAGYKLALFDSREGAFETLSDLVEFESVKKNAGSLYELRSEYTEPETKEEIVEEAAPCEGPCEGCEESQGANLPEAPDEVSEESEKTADEVVEEQIKEDGPVYG